jgi:hypothetical protein
MGPVTFEIMIYPVHRHFGTERTFVDGGIESLICGLSQRSRRKVYDKCRLFFDVATDEELRLLNEHLI